MRIATAPVLVCIVAVAATDLALVAGRARPAAPPVAAAHVARAPSAVAAADLALPRPVAAASRVTRRRLPSGHRSGLAPDRVAIPRQGVSAPIDVCAMAAGELEPPADVSRTCRWAGGADLGAQRGTVALTGHINWVGQGTGAFGRIGELRRGDVVVTSDARGDATRWRVVSVEFRDKSRGVDLTAFAGPSGPRALYLISCGGPYDAAAASYLDNIYVRATPVTTT